MNQIFSNHQSSSSHINIEDYFQEGKFNEKIILDGKIILDYFLHQRNLHLASTKCVIDYLTNAELKAYVLREDYVYVINYLKALVSPRELTKIQARFQQLFIPLTANNSIKAEACKLIGYEHHDAVLMILAKHSNIHVIISNKRYSEFDINGFVAAITPKDFNEMVVIPKSKLLQRDKDFCNNIIGNNIEDFDLISTENINELLVIDDRLEIESFSYSSTKNHLSRAEVILYDNQNPQEVKKITSSKQGEGGFSVLRQALEDAVIKSGINLEAHFEFYHIDAETVGEQMQIEVTVTVLKNGYFYRESYYHTDTSKAFFYAYVKLLNRIIRAETVTSSDLDQCIETYFKQVTVNFKEQALQPSQVLIKDFQKIVKCINIPIDFIKDKIKAELAQNPVDNDKYCRIGLYDDYYFHLYVIIWKEGHKTDFHHHGEQSLDAFKVIQGSLKHWQGLRKDFPESSSDYEPSGCKVPLPDQPENEILIGTQLSEWQFIDRDFCHGLACNKNDTISIHLRFGCPPDDDHWCNHPNSKFPSSYAI